MKTAFFNDFDHWKIQGYNKAINVQTVFNNDTERGNILGDFEGTIRTIFSNNYNQWSIDAELSGLEEDLQKAVIFTAIFTSFMQKK